MIDTSSEEHRYKCEIRHILKLRTLNQQRAMSYIELIGKRRCELVAKKMQEDASNQWNKSNRGAYGDWR